MPARQTVRMPLRLLLALGLAATVVACDHAAPEKVGENLRQVTVVGSGHVQGVPDTLTADVGTEFVAPDVTAAMNQTNDRGGLASSVPLEPGQQTVSCSVTAIWELR